MPKERRKRTAAHDPSAKLAKRQFAVQEAAVEHVDIGDAIEASATSILTEMDEDQAPVLKKKEKQLLKREAFVQRLESAHTPYSKSHNRRVKRKAKEELAGGLGAMELAISALVNDDNAEEQEVDTEDSNSNPNPRPKPKPGQIGQGKGVPLNKTQRKRALEMERLRHPLILTNPAFSSNPFETIRTHAQNTLLKHQP